MGLPSITRGVGFRDDGAVAANYVPLFTANTSVGTVTTDGDIVTVPVTFTTATNSNTAGVVLIIPGSLLTATFLKFLIRHYDSGLPANVNLTIQVKNASGNNTQANLTKSTAFVNDTINTFQEANGTLATVYIYIQPNLASGTLTASYTFYIDFAQAFKETLTLPTAIQPLAFRKQRNIIEVPILQREGGQVQDLGSLSPEVTIGGGLVSTISGQSGWTNTYTADQWWQLLYGVAIEVGTIQNDGNPTWQWLASDDINGKMLVRGFSAQQVPGRIAYHNYTLALKQFDVNAETTASLPGITY